MGEGSKAESSVRTRKFDKKKRDTFHSFDFWNLLSYTPAPETSPKNTLKQKTRAHTHSFWQYTNQSGMSMDEDDGMIPLYKPTSRAPLPIDVSILKRKNPEGSNGLQHFDNDGEELIIDDELLDEDDLKYSVQEEDYTNNEARSKRQKVQESTVREMVAENALRRKKRAGHKLTRDEKRLAVVLRRQSLTNSDQMARYANDEDSLISIPVVSPFRSFVEETLGPERPRTQCFGCTKGVGRAGTTGRAIAGLERMIKETISTQDVWTACVMISEHYELEIRQPANANRSKQEAELLEWSERSVYDHLT